MASSTLPPISHILETCLYVKDVPAAAEFYKKALQIEPFSQSDRGACFALGHTTLLLFKLGGTTTDLIVESRGIIPKHGPTESNLLPSLLAEETSEGETKNSLRQHFCFAVPSPDDVGKWDAHFQELGVKILGRMDWEKGGKSVYFEDLDGHVGEVGSRGVWAHYPLE
ncbi:hypothetical protein FQN54_008206 [Arachnomyces sp. PD_36]|nr:hypothetical protein FQN54_008206 [Arachnomyces sp. PD_36]